MLSLMLFNSQQIVNDLPELNKDMIESIILVAWTLKDLKLIEEFDETNDRSPSLY